MRALKWVLLALLVATQASAQNYPSPTYNVMTLRNIAAPVGQQQAQFNVDSSGSLLGSLLNAGGAQQLWLTVNRSGGAPFAATFYEPIQESALSTINLINLNRTNVPGGVPSPLQLGDYIGQLNFQGFAQTQYSTYVSSFSCAAEENWTNTANGSFCTITSTPSGSVSPIQLALFSPTYGIVEARTFSTNPVGVHDFSTPTATIARTTTFTGGTGDWDANALWVPNTVSAGNAYSERAITGTLNNYSTTGSNLNGGVVGEGVKFGAATSVGNTMGTAGVCFDQTGRTNPTNYCAGLIAIVGYQHATPTTDTNHSLAGLIVWASGLVPGQHVGDGVRLDFYAPGVTYDNGLRFSNAGTFVNGINFTGATVSGYQILGNGWSVDPSGNATFLSVPAANIAFTQTGTGATTSTVDARLKQEVFVTDFTGVDKTGATDSLAGIQNAISTGNRRVVFPCGTYNVSGPILLNNSYTALEGEGEGCVIIRTTSSTADIVQIGDGTNPVILPSIKNIILWSTVTKTAGAAILARKTNDTLIYNVSFGTQQLAQANGKQLFNGLIFAEFVTSKLSYNRFAGMSNDCIQVYGNSAQTYGAEFDMNVSNFITDCGHDGVVVGGGAGGVRLDMNVQKSGRYNLLIDNSFAVGGAIYNREVLLGPNFTSDTATLDGVRVNRASIFELGCTGCWSAGNGGTGFLIVGGQAVGATLRFANPHFEYNTSHGFYFKFSVEGFNGSLVLTGGNVSNNGNTVASHGIWVETPNTTTSSFLINGARVANNGTGGIGFGIIASGASASYFNISGNDLVGNSQGPASVTSTCSSNLPVWGNTSYDNNCIGTLNANSGTLTASKSNTFSQTWNNVAVVFTALKVSVANLGSATGSLLQDWQFAGSSKASIDKTGAMTLAGTLTLPASTTSIGSLSMPHGVAPSSPTDGLFWTTTAGLFGRINGATKTFATLEDAHTWLGLQTFNGGIDVNGGTLTVSTPTTITQTWNNSGVTFIGFGIDITDTASAAGSEPFRVRVGGTPVFFIDKFGGTAAYTLTASGFILTPSLYGGSATNSTLSLYSTTAAGGAGNAVGIYTGSQVLRWKVDENGHLLAGADNTYDIGASGATRPRNGFFAGNITIGDATALIKSSIAMNNGAAANTGTLLNAPAAGNPTKWIPVNDNGTTRYIPAW